MPLYFITPKFGQRPEGADTLLPEVVLGLNLNAAASYLKTFDGNWLFRDIGIALDTLVDGQASRFLARVEEAEQKHNHNLEDPAVIAAVRAELEDAEAALPDHVRALVEYLRPLAPRDRSPLFPQENPTENYDDLMACAVRLHILLERTEVNLHINVLRSQGQVADELAKAHSSIALRVLDVTAQLGTISNLANRAVVAYLQG